MTNVVEITFSFAVAKAEFEELLSFSKSTAARAALAELLIEKGEEFIRVIAAPVHSAFHLEAVLCDEARALLQAWRTAA